MFLLIILSWQILLIIVGVKKKKRGIKAIDGFRRQLFIPDHQIYDSIEHKVQSKIGRIFVNEDIREYSIRIYEIDLYFSENYFKKIQVDNNGQQ